MRPAFPLRRLARLSLAVSVLLASVPAFAAPVRMAFLGVSGGEGVSEKTRRTAEELVLTELDHSGRFHVIGRSDIAALLGFEKQRQLLGCEDDTSCVSELAGALGVDLIAAGDLGGLGQTRIVSLKLVDVAHATVLARSAQKLRSDDELPEALSRAVSALLPAADAWVRARAGVGAEDHPRFVSGGLLGAGVLAAGAAVVLGFQAKSAAGEWAAATDEAAWSSARARAEAAGTHATEAWIVAGALGATAAAVFGFTSW